MSETIIAAAREFIARRDRRTHPEGSFDRKSRFTLSERCSCCAGIRTPSARFPWSEMKHGRTAEHVAHLHGVNPADVRKVARQLEKSASA